MNSTLLLSVDETPGSRRRLARLLWPVACHLPEALAPLFARLTCPTTGELYCSAFYNPPAVVGRLFRCLYGPTYGPSPGIRYSNGVYARTGAAHRLPDGTLYCIPTIDRNSPAVL